jgi:hypothetical protein
MHARCAILGAVLAVGCNDTEPVETGDGGPGIFNGIERPCDTELTRTTDFGAFQTEVTQSFAVFDLVPAEVTAAFVCDPRFDPTACPEGATCTGDAFAPDCPGALPSLVGGQLWVPCGQQSVTSSDGQPDQVSETRHERAIVFARYDRL